MEKKRKGYKNIADQLEANKRYRATEAGKEVQKKAVAKSQAKKFIKEMANLAELAELENLIKERKGEIKMEEALETLDLLVNEKNCDYELKIKNNSEYKEYYLDIWSYDFDMYVFSEFRENLIELLEDGIKKLEEWSNEI